MTDKPRAPGSLLVGELTRRGLVGDCSDIEGLTARLADGPTGFYVGFDPTATSLHVGSLMPLLVQQLVVNHGHHAVLLVGGTTGMIGDPSGRSDERNLLDDDQLERNTAGVRDQITRLVCPGSGRVTVVDNRDWLAELSAIELLRDVGRHFPLNTMLGRDSVRQRRESDGGMSFTELSYQLLQAHDFWWLRHNLDVEVQLGGSDQWGNITAGIDYIRRRDSTRAWGLVWPLFTKADGTKFGKTAAGNVWLDAALTSVFSFWQFWYNTDDADSETMLMRFDPKDTTELERIAAAQRSHPEQRPAQRALANDVTAWVHGPESAANAEQAAAALFDSDTRLSPKALNLIEAEVGALRLSRHELLGADIAQLAVRGGLCTSSGDARRLAAQGGLHLGERTVTPDQGLRPGDLTEPGWALLRKGRKQWLLLRAVD